MTSAILSFPVPVSPVIRHRSIRMGHQRDHIKYFLHLGAVADYFDRSEIR